MTAPLPPLEIALRSGSTPGPDEDPYADWLGVGAASRAQIERLVGPQWDWRGKRVLDFGCGAGRTLRHFLDLSDRAELWGCDIFADGVEWLESNLAPPLQVRHTGETPPLPFEDGQFDLVYALSVFTHLTGSWADWVRELHRIIADDGVLVATFVGKEMIEAFLPPGYEHDDVGMNALVHWLPWDLGGPYVMHSDWWLERHWGQAFELEEMVWEAEEEIIRAQRWGAFRRRPGAPDPQRMQAVDGADPREVRALELNLAQLRAEIDKLVEEGVDRPRVRAVARRYESTLSWRLTRPLRAAGRLIRRDAGA